MDVSAEAGADGEVELVLEGLFPVHDEVSGAAEEFFDPVPER
ncbi:hypothetical protein [Nocardiopsis coralli]|nr:hypothetical protein [Nocardiopsis coralli]